MTASIEVDAQSNGKTISLASGQALLIRLAENPTSGFRWFVASHGSMRLDADEFTPADTSIGGIGAGGTRQLQWSVAVPGRSEIVLALKRAWDAGDAAIEHFQLTVVSS
jgi:inhibitor of cysteine peptidase